MQKLLLLLISQNKTFSDDVRKTPQRCCQYYPGEKPFSTAEAQAIRHYVDKIGVHINLAIHLHVSFVPKKVNDSPCDIFVAEKQFIGKYIPNRSEFRYQSMVHVHNWRDEQDQRQSNDKSSVATILNVYGSRYWKCQRPQISYTTGVTLE